ncbi:Chromate resistance protein ChrB [Caulobacter sp. DWR1-3-2b1]|uniref:Chromate resistance protein ChrB n=1 Tax=Caulobacter sp. DWR1-3-2b1 TaxID=2804670 RepID=UPI003CFB4914
MFLAQLPASPSSARVALWRRLRAAGAVGSMTGAWVLPAGEAHATLFRHLAEAIRAQGGQAAVRSPHP